MKKTFKWLFAWAIAMASLTTAAQSIEFSIHSGYNQSTPTQSSIETNITNLLNALYEAGTEGKVPSIESINMESRAKTRLLALWDNCPFVCEDVKNIFPCLTDVEGYQVRGIPVTMKPTDDLYTGDKARELVISFNRNGIITGVSLALNNVNAEKIMGTGNAVTEMTERRMILKFVEDFRCYYNEKDTAALRAVYSDDAIIITGSVVHRKQQGDVSCSKEEIRYNKQNKEQYMTSLKRCFKNNKYINVEFDKIDVVKHPTRNGYYGVTLHQKWDSSNYSDDGWLFLLWNFKNPEEPAIHVRTWQPQQVEESSVFTIDDFRLD